MPQEFAKKVLIVDDEPHLRALMKLILGGMGVEETQEAGDSANALLMYQYFKPDLVTLDVNMPGEDGLAILQKIIALDPDARVIMMTAVASREVVEQTAALGAINYIRKDTPREQMMKALRDTWADVAPE